MYYRVSLYIADGNVHAVDSVKEILAAGSDDYSLSIRPVGGLDASSLSVLPAVGLRKCTAAQRYGRHGTLAWVTPDSGAI